MFFKQFSKRSHIVVAARGSTGLFVSIALAACQISDPVDAAQTDFAPDSDLQKAAEQYCYEDATETAQYLLTHGTPDDVDIMEEAIVMLDDGEWMVFAEIQGPAQQLENAESVHAGAVGTVWLVDLSCRWQTPLPDLNGEYQFELEILLSPDAPHRALRRPSSNQ